MSFILSACAQAEQSPTPPVTSTPPTEQTEIQSSLEPETLTVMTHDSFAVSDEVISAFENSNNIRVQFLASGDAGTALNKAILAKGNTLADVFYGVDNTFLSRALEEDIFTPYQSPGLGDIPDNFELDPEYRALPVDYGDVCPNYDLGFFEEKNLKPPENIEDLVADEYRECSWSRILQLLRPDYHFSCNNRPFRESDGYLQYWEGSAEMVLVVNDWDTAYYSEFTRRVHSSNRTLRFQPSL
jgi:thiamine transport system substrate-binding protein